LEKTAPPPPVRQYRLTVQTDPPQATVRLLNAKTPYQPGVMLPPGNYTVAISQAGYEATQVAVPIFDSDVTVPVKLAKKPEPPKPTMYRLTVQADPADARVRLRGSKTAYKAGILLPPGNYTVEIARTGYETKQLPVRIADGDVSVPVSLLKQPEPEPPTLYRLTVQADPADARVRLLGSKIAYRPGVSLPPGGYTVEVSRAGYETQRLTARVAGSDVTVPVVLVKQPEPSRYALTVRPEPADAQVRLRGTNLPYRPGVSLAPGSYTVDVAKAGYETRQVSVRIADGDVTVPVALVKLPEPSRYALTVRPEPADAQVRLRGTRIVYQPGISLAPGNYTVEVSKIGYETKQLTVRIADGEVTVPVALAKPPEPTQYRLTVRSNPEDARVRLVNSSYVYRPGVPLPPGHYTVEVSDRGYESKRVSVRIADDDVTVPVELEKLASAPTPSPAPASPAPSRGEWRIGSVQVDSSMSGVDRTEVSRILSGYIGRTVTRDTLLDGAMRVYQATGVTVSFVVRPGASGGAALYARAARQARRTYESSLSIMSRSQLENSGFGVSVE
ncbi:MAG: hypothetical protein WAV81_10405, partial [Candidatus Competibacter sp.]